MTRPQIRLTACSLTIAAIVVSYLWIDQPIAFFAYNHRAFHGFFVDLTFIPEPLPGLALTMFFALGLWALIAKPASKLYTVLLTCSISLIVAEATKSQLKYIFGRTWPETFVNNNPSLISNNAYGFNFLHGGAGYASFPSGHMTAICAVASVLWIYYPRFRALYALVVAAVAIGLLGADYHFLSDIIAGSFLGTVTGWLAVVLQEQAASKLTGGHQARQ
jgi:membrane-associated phospholipid phosphatase